jgi:hypothetical protein
MASVGAWVAENCSSVGFDDLTLTGAVSDYTEFSRAIPAGDVWYAIKDSNGNREEGIGSFDGSVTIVRHTIHVTLEGGNYYNVDPEPISLSGTCIVSCTVNSTALRNVLDELPTIITVAPESYLNHNYTQGVASNSWLIVHSLSKNPSVTVIDSSGSQVEGEVQYIDENTLRINFSAAFSGNAYLN